MSCLAQGIYDVVAGTNWRFATWCLGIRGNPVEVLHIMLGDLGTCSLVVGMRSALRTGSMGMQLTRRVWEAFVSRGNQRLRSKGCC